MPVYEEKKKVDGKKRYYISFYIKDVNGKPKRIKRHNKEWVGKEGYYLAQQEESYLKKKKEQDNKSGFKKKTLDELYELFIKSKENTIKYSYLLKIQQNYNIYIKDFFKNIYYYEITTLDIQKWKDDMYKKGLAFSTLKNAFTTLSSILEYGCEYYGLEKNVAKIAKNFKKAKGIKKKEMNFITKEQFDKAIEYETNYIYKTALSVLFYTGMRRGEMLALDINDLDFENNKIRIDETVNPKISMIPSPPKTNKSNRTIEVLPFIMDMIRKVVDETNSENNYIFLNNIKLTTLKRKCDKILLESGLESDKLIRIHDLRHSFASMCINSGVDIQIISGYMGHENISITWDTYGHLYPNSHKKLLEKINK